MSFAPNAPCAIDPKAFGFWFDPPRPASIERVGDIAILDVRGPLMHHEEWWCDSYDAIKARVGEAIALGVKSIVMSIDSPGGLVSGCFDTADEIRALCDDADVDLFAHVDGQACSAAYALAAVATRIAIPTTGTAGSIGVIAELVSAVGMDAKYGIERRLVVSGARKADGHPGGPITDAAASAVQAEVDQLAELFFEHVARHRGLQPDALRALEAGVLIGARATPLLADEVMGLDAMVAAIAAGEFGSASRSEGEETMTVKNQAGATAKAEGDDKDDKDESATSKARKILQAAADDGDEEAKKSLAAMGDDEKEADAPVPEKKDDDDKKDDKDAKAMASEALTIARGLKASFDANAARADADERAGLLATRPDLDDATRDLLASAPIAKVRTFVKASPKRVGQKSAAASVVPVTRGATQGKSTGATKTPTTAGVDEADEPLMEQDPVASRAMRARMGLIKNESSIIDDGAQLIVGAPPGYVT